MENRNKESNLEELAVFTFIIVLEIINFALGFVSVSLMVAGKDTIIGIVGIILLPIFFLLADKISSSRSDRVNILKDKGLISTKVVLLARVIIVVVLLLVLSQFIR